MSLMEEGDLKLSVEMKKSICTSIYYRLRAAEAYSNSVRQPIKSSIVLIKPTQPTLNSMPDDYGLHKVSYLHS